MNLELLSDLQEDLASRLEAAEYFVDIPVFAEHRKQSASELQQQRATLTTKGGKSGVAVIVMSPTATVKLVNVVNILDLRLVARVLENPERNNATNGTHKHAMDVARQIAIIIGGYHPAGFAMRINPADPTIEPVEDPIAPVAYDVNFSCREEDRDLPAKVAAPVISPSSGAAPQTVTITCSTVGAAIYYTLDGSYPSAGNANAQLYSAAVAVAAAGTLRACASKAGAIDSDTTRGDYE